MDEILEGDKKTRHGNDVLKTTPTPMNDSEALFDTIVRNSLTANNTMYTNTTTATAPNYTTMINATYTSPPGTTATQIQRRHAEEAMRRNYYGDFDNDNRWLRTDPESLRGLRINTRRDIQRALQPMADRDIRENYRGFVSLIERLYNVSPIVASRLKGMMRSQESTYREYQYASAMDSPTGPLNPLEFLLETRLYDVLTDVIEILYDENHRHERQEFERRMRHSMREITFREGD